jgi:radical SAM superfamily enzyme YgiQ (UPF0313 family)
MQIVVTNPPWDGIRAGSRWPTKCRFGAYFPYPHNLAGGVASLRKAGHDVVFLDAIAMRMRMYDLAPFIERVDLIKPDLIIQEISTPSLPDDRCIGEKLADIAPLAVCGPHASGAGASLLAEWPFLLAVLKGEIERSSVRLAATMQRQVYPFEYSPNLDTYPPPALENLYLYRDVPGPNGGITYQMQGSRGCPWSCTFCIEPWCDTGKPSWRPKSPRRIVEEARKAHELFPRLDGAYLDGPTENVGDQRCREIAHGFQQADIPFAMMCRFDILQLDTWDYMAERGLFYVKGGLESANQELVKTTRKRLQVAKVKETVEHLKKLLPARNIHLAVMWGIPGETSETVKETLAFVRDLGVYWQESYCAPATGTPLRAMQPQLVTSASLAAAGESSPLNPEVAEWVKEAKG